MTQIAPLNRRNTPAALLTVLIALAAGCSTHHETARTTPAPIYTSQSQATATGAPGTSTEMATGKGAGGASAGATAPATTSAPGQVTIPLYKEEVTVGTRSVPAGTVHLKKSVRTENFNQPVQLRQETLTVNKTEPTGGANALPPTGRTDQAQPGGQNAQPGGENPQAGGQNLQPSGQTSQAGGQNPQAAQATPFTDQDIVIQLYREEPVVQKKIVPQGQIVANKESTTQQQNIQEQVRREEIQIQKSGDAKNVNVSGDLKSVMQNAPQTAENKPSEQEAAQGSPPAGQQQTAGAGSSRAISDMNTLTSSMSDPSTLVDRPIQLSGTPVQSVLNDQWFAFGDPSGTQIYVHSPKPVSNLKAGDNANLTGTIKQFPSDTSQLGLDQQSSQKLQGQRIYVEASQITPAEK